MADDQCVTRDVDDASIRSITAQSAGGDIEGMSVAGRLVHYKAILDSFLAGDGGFVSDFYLAAHGTNRDIVRELQSLWVWRRVPGGFVPSEAEVTRVAVAVSDALAAALSTGEPPDVRPERLLQSVADDEADTGDAG